MTTPTSDCSHPSLTFSLSFSHSLCIISLSPDGEWVETLRGCGPVCRGRCKYSVVKELLAAGTGLVCFNPRALGSTIWLTGPDSNRQGLERLRVNSPLGYQFPAPVNTILMDVTGFEPAKQQPSAFRNRAPPCLLLQPAYLRLFASGTPLWGLFTTLPIESLGERNYAAILTPRAQLPPRLREPVHSTVYWRILPFLPHAHISKNNGGG